MSVVRKPDHLALSLQVAQKSLTLLSNRRSRPAGHRHAAPPRRPSLFLPLKREETRSIAVIGPAGDQDYPTGNYYGTPARKVGVVQGLREVLGAGVDDRLREGRGLRRPGRRRGRGPRGGAGEAGGRRDPLPRHRPAGRSREPRPPRPEPPGAQQPLLEAVFAANPRVALVLFNAGPLAVTAGRTIGCRRSSRRGSRAKRAASRWRARCSGIDNPGGKLPYTVYANLDGVPPQNEYDVSKGYTYQYFKGVPLYPFGHGLSYTRFRFSNLTLSAPSISARARSRSPSTSPTSATAPATRSRSSTRISCEAGLSAAPHAAGLPPRHAAAEGDDARHVHAAGVAARLVSGRHHRIGGRARRLRHRRRRVVRQHPAARAADRHGRRGP